MLAFAKFCIDLVLNNDTDEHAQRKNELLQLGKSKQERIEAELAAIREVRFLL